MSGIEPTPQSGLTIVHTVYTTVLGIKFKDGLYYTNFDGSRESIAFPTEAFTVGDKVKITFQKVPQPCPPSPTTNPPPSSSS